MATRYTEALADAICARVCAGESPRSICEDEGMPDEAITFLPTEVWEVKTD